MTPLTFATVGLGKVPLKSPPAVAEIVAAVPSPKLVRTVLAVADSSLKLLLVCNAPVILVSLPIATVLPVVPVGMLAMGTWLELLRGA